MKIYIDGRDNMGWSIDCDRNGVQNSLTRLNTKETSFFWNADIVHNLWWNSFFSLKKLPLRVKRNILMTASNFINMECHDSLIEKNFEKAKTIAKGWIAPSTKQKKILESYGLRTYYQPFYLDLNLFSPPSRPRNVYREKLFAKFSIPPEKFKNKIIIGSFQRDSLGTDLSRPKWQKGPDILIQLLKNLSKDKFILLLAGPRRHYVIEECKKHDIPYFYIGNETREDDLFENKLDIQDMPGIYALTDIYLVTSKSEGGPKAILEATATKTFILSTDVGLASDFLPLNCIFSNLEAFEKHLFEMVEHPHKFEQSQQTAIENNYLKCKNILDYDKMDKRLSDIYTDILL